MSTRSIILAVEGISPYGGVAVYLQNLALGLERRGWEVHLLVTNYRGESFDSFCPSLQRHDLSEMPLSSKKVFAAARLINSIRPDVLLINHCSLMNYALPLLAREIKPVAVLHSDADAFYRSAARFAKYLFRWIAPTPGVASNFIDRLPARLRPRIQVIPHGIDTRLFHRSDRDVTPVPNRIAFVGFIAENKGADQLPKIMASVLKKQPDAHLDIVGYGPLQPHLESDFAGLAISDRVTFVGKLEPADVASLLRQSAMFLLPTQVEGFGLAIVEAMLCGAVPIVSRLAGVTDWIIKDGSTGILCDARDAEAFSAAVVRLLEDRQRLADMSTNASREAAKRFAGEVMLDAYEALFNERDDRRRSGPRGLLVWGALTTGEVLRKTISSRPGKRRASSAQRSIVGR